MTRKSPVAGTVKRHKRGKLAVGDRVVRRADSDRGRVKRGRVGTIEKMRRYKKEPRAWVAFDDNTAAWFRTAVLRRWQQLKRTAQAAPARPSRTDVSAEHMLIEACGLKPSDFGRRFWARWEPTRKWWQYTLTAIRKHPDTPLGGRWDDDEDIYWFSPAKVRFGLAYEPPWTERGDTELDYDVPEPRFVQGGLPETNRRRH